MATTYGVTPEGFFRKPQDVCLSEINASQKAKLGEDWDTSPESVMGQVNAIAARREGLLWELLETAYGAFDPDKAEEFLLTALAKLTGTERDAADYSTVLMRVNLDEGVILESGTHFVEHETDASIRVTPVEDYESPSDGNHNVPFRAENKGPLVAGTNTLNVIATPVVGWNSANNPSFDLEGGREIAEDPELRIDREAQIANSAGSTLDGIAAALRATDGILTVLPFENVRATTDENGLPPNSFEMVIWDGEGSDVDDDDIAQVIWGKKGSGARSFGKYSGTAEDANGDDQVVHFSRSAIVPIYLAFDIEPGENFDADAFKIGVAAAADELFTGGKDVLATRLISIAWQQDNIENVLAVRLGLAVSPTLDDDIPIGIREIARFETTRVAVTLL